MELSVLQAFGTALFIGALVGTERTQHRQGEPNGFAGLRTFILFAELGALLAYLSTRWNAIWLFALGLVCVSIVVVAAYLVQRFALRESPGMTTEVTAIVVYVLGGLALLKEGVLAVALAIITAALLATKETLHEGVRRISRVELLAALRLLFASFIVLPILPKHPIDPWQVLSPYKLCVLVILISALSMVGYVAVRILGEARGIVVTGFFGGLVSSTAATLTFARQSRESQVSREALASGILLSWTVMFLRVIVLVAVLRWSLLRPLGIPLAALAVLGAALCGVSMMRAQRAVGHHPILAHEASFTNPFRLLSAIKFACVFAAVLLAAKAVSRYAPGAGIYWLAAIAGSTDVDAIVLSISELGKNSGATELVLARGILIACLANTLVKFGLAGGLGSRELLRVLAVPTVVLFAAGTAAMVVLG